ncbi:MAG TPA: hypothetical protein PLO93_01150 [Candidatus Omnitrophota bacterium]|nr:hypothetical protein [Candidatus Omnitrophota bacterium]HQL40886.1 hypothetical protein [Candidatus Omnitrophota bacterium]
MKKVYLCVIYICFFFVIAGSARVARCEEIAVASEGFTPRCSSHQECARPGLLGICQSPGEKTSRCLWQEIVKIPVVVIEPDQCRSCQSEIVLEQLKMFFPGLEAERLKASDVKAKELIKKLKIKMLPAYILGKEIEQEISFTDFEPMVSAAEGQYYLKPEFAGVSYFSDRARRNNQLDIFLVMTSPGMYQSAKIAQEISKDKKHGVNVNVHFLGLQDVQSKKIISPGGEREINENKVFACVEKYYPQKALDYLVERLLDTGNIWIDNVLQANGCDVKKVKACAQSSQGEKLYQQKVSLSQDLDIRYAPLFLMENTEIFGVTERTTASEILKTLKLSNPKK